MTGFLFLVKYIGGKMDVKRLESRCCGKGSSKDGW
jgi:hypothetical protein